MKWKTFSAHLCLRYGKSAHLLGLEPVSLMIENALGCGGMDLLNVKMIMTGSNAV